MTVLDVGQGDAIYIQGPRGGRALIDTGPDPNRLVSLLDQRIPSWDRRLDLVVITHPHEDHIAGMAALMDRYRIGEIAEPGMIGPGPGDAAFRQRLAETGRQSRIIAAGDHLTLDGDSDGRAVAAPRDRAAAPARFRHCHQQRLDRSRRPIRHAADRARRRRRAADRPAAAGRRDRERRRPLDVLKVAHHGSATRDHRLRSWSRCIRAWRSSAPDGAIRTAIPPRDSGAPASSAARRCSAPTSTARSTSARTAPTWSRTPAAADRSRRRHRRRRRRDRFLPDPERGAGRERTDTAANLQSRR